MGVTLCPAPCNQDNSMLLGSQQLMALIALQDPTGIGEVGQFCEAVTALKAVAHHFVQQMGALGRKSSSHGRGNVVGS